MENRRRFISIINLEHPRTITQGIGFSNAQKQFPSKDLGLLTAIVNSIRARKTKRKRSGNACEGSLRQRDNLCATDRIWGKLLD
jgi:hypothetical protein